jgi:hypothetical protein
MTRRQFLGCGVLLGPAASASGADGLVLPIHVIVDKLVKWAPGDMDRFYLNLWAEAVSELRDAGVAVRVTLGDGGVERLAQRQPILSGLVHGAINFVVTTEIPMAWDRGRALCGVTTRYRGYHVCMIALNHAHGNRLPFLAVNTCLHELLHALLLDIFESRPPGLWGQAREFRIDLYATRLWLGDGGSMREAARTYLKRLRLDEDAQAKGFSPVLRP